MHHGTARINYLHITCEASFRHPHDKWLQIAFVIRGVFAETVAVAAPPNHKQMLHKRSVVRTRSVCVQIEFQAKLQQMAKMLSIAELEEGIENKPIFRHTLTSAV